MKKYTSDNIINEASKTEDFDTTESTAAESDTDISAAALNHSSSNCNHTTTHDAHYSAESDLNNTISGSDYIDKGDEEVARNQHERNRIMKGDDPAPLITTTTSTLTELAPSASAATTTTTASTTTTSSIRSPDDEKDIRDCLTPEALVRAASEAYQGKSLLNSDESTPIFLRVHNAIDKEDCEHENEGKEDDTDKLLASIPPELTRTPGHPTSAALSRPGAYQQYNTISVAAPEAPPQNSNSSSSSSGHPTAVEPNRRAPSDSESFLIEATLVTEESRPAEPPAPSPPRVVAPIYNAQIVQDADLHQNESQITNQEHGNVTISKWKLRCIIVMVILLLIVCIVSITVPLVNKKGGKDDDEDKGGEGDRAGPEFWHQILNEQKQKLLSQNSDNYQVVTHHSAVITIHHQAFNNDTTTTPSKTCIGPYDLKMLDEDDVQDRNLRRSSSSRISGQSHLRQQRALSEDEDEDSGNEDGEMAEEVVGVVITLTCGTSTSRDDTTTPPIILLHNFELHDSLSYNSTYVEMPLCYNELFRPRKEDDDDLTKKENEEMRREKKKPEDYFAENDVDPMIYSTYQCVVSRTSPVKDLIEQYVFIYTCASDSSSGNDGVPSTSGSDNAADEDAIVSNVTTIHVRNAATYCGLPANSTMDDSPPPVITSITISTQRLCRNESTDGNVIIPFQQHVLTNRSDATNHSSSSSYLCRDDDGNNLDPSVIANGTKYYYDYCTTRTDIEPLDPVYEELGDVNFQTFCGQSGNNVTTDDTISQFCDEIRKSSFDYFEYLIPSMAMIDNIRQSNIQTSAKCSFDTLNSSFIAVAPSEENSWMTLFGFPPTMSGSTNITGMEPSKESLKLIVNLQDLLLDTLAQLEQLRP